MPAIPEKTQAFFDQKSKDYPFVTPDSWDVFVQGLAYPVTPSSEQYQPNSIEATARFATFMDLLNNTPPDQLDFEPNTRNWLTTSTPSTTSKQHVYNWGGPGIWHAPN